ncbi:MAG: response regulator [Acholeplasmatales bacterium]|jgi:PAS domain S-box-containing protein|nr:response regulator [Acholeplasmatales bacterium]
MKDSNKSIKRKVTLKKRLLTILLSVKIIPLIIVVLVSAISFITLAGSLTSLNGVLSDTATNALESSKNAAINDAVIALNDSATDNIERVTTDTASAVANFLYARDNDVLELARNTELLYNSSNDTFIEQLYRNKMTNSLSQVVVPGKYELVKLTDIISGNPYRWERKKPLNIYNPATSSNEQNDEKFHIFDPNGFEYKKVAIYDEIVFLDINGYELVRVVAGNDIKLDYNVNKVRPESDKRNVSDYENTFVKAEKYFDEIEALEKGEIYVSDVIGAYVRGYVNGLNSIFSEYTVKDRDEKRGALGPIPEGFRNPEENAYAGIENPVGIRFRGIVRFVTPVYDSTDHKVGYVSLALNHDHIMEFVDRIMPTPERYTELPNADEGNYAFIWDYQIRSIAHPRHYSIYGYDPETGEPTIPWIQNTAYDELKKLGLTWENPITDDGRTWLEYFHDIDEPQFHNQLRSNTPAQDLTYNGFVGLDGRYLNNAPQCTGWRDISQYGGSGSLLILWVGLYKLSTVSAIPYYTGKYQKTYDEDHNLLNARGFGVVTIGAGFEFYNSSANKTEAALNDMITRADLVITTTSIDIKETINGSLSNTLIILSLVTGVILVVIVFIAIIISNSITEPLNSLNIGINKFKKGYRSFRFNSDRIDEFGDLADAFDEMANSVVESVKSPLVIIDNDRRILYINDQGLILRNKLLVDVIGTNYENSSIYPINSIYDPIYCSEMGVESEVLYLERLNIYVKAKANTFYDSEGNKIGYLIVSTDVTDIILEQQKINEQRLLLDMVFKSSPDLIWYHDEDGKYVTVNPRFASVVGKDETYFIGKTAEEIFSGAMLEQFTKDNDIVVKSKNPHFSEEKIHFFDGHEEIVDSVRTPIFDENETFRGILGFGRNITNRVTMEHQLMETQDRLQLAVEEANEASAHKGEFLARMSHEIRTPMNAIIGLNNIVLKKLSDMDDGVKYDAIIKNLNQIGSSSIHLLGILNDILDLSKIDAGKIELSDDVLGFGELCETVKTIIKPRCDDKSIDYITDFDEEIFKSDYISDPLRLRQILINLLGNAVKFTPELGTIRFTIKRVSGSDASDSIYFEISDTGIGIAEDTINTLFNPFEQGSNTITRKYGGTGLGLSISQRMVQLFGGSISVQSVVGEGSKFSFEIKIKKTVKSVYSETDDINTDNLFKGKRLLLVDDVEINRFVVITLLDGSGFEIEEAVDGIDAVNKFKNSPVGYYDMILMDVQMPNLDGYGASRHIRSINRSDSKTIPIVALSANAFQDDIKKSLEAGMNDHLAKPVELDKLNKTFIRFLQIIK